MHVPPIEFEKVVQVPPEGLKLPFAGPFVIVHVKIAVCPYLTMPGLAARVQDGGFPMILTEYVPPAVCGEGLVQLSLHVAVKLQVPAALGVPDIVAPEDVQDRFKPLQLAGVQEVFETGA